MEYKKTPKTIKDQIELIKSRGLIVDNEERLEKYLTNISYYHLSAYFKSFQRDDKFNNGITFEDVINLYEFDKKLRLLLLDVLERIEKSFKCVVVYSISIEHSDPFWYSNKDLYFRQGAYLDIVEPILESIQKSREVSVRHFYEKYKDNKYPPSWIGLEVLTFGECVKLCRQLNRTEQNLFSRSYGLDRKYLLNWMHGLSMVRNICAHHSRLWNKNIVLPVQYNHRTYKQFFNEDRKAIMRLYNWLVVIHIMMKKINSTSGWLDKFKSLILEYDVHIVSMGMPEDWEERFEKIKELEDGFDKLKI